MARKPVVLVTGASGEMGHGLIHRLAELGTVEILALDLRPLDAELAPCCAATRVGDVLDNRLLDRLASEFEISAIFHLAALLSSRAEFVPETAHAVNVQGTMNLFRLAVEEARSLGSPLKFLFPSSIRRLRAPGSVHQEGYRQGVRGPVVGARHDVRLQQALLRAPGPLLHTPLSPARPPGSAEWCRLPGDSLSGVDLGVHGTERWNE